MEGVIELLYRHPSDERVLLSAVGLAEKDQNYTPLLLVLSDSKVGFDLSSKSFLRALSLCLEWTDVTQWPLPLIETVLVSNLPRWGYLIGKDSLADLLRVVHVMVFRGLGVLCLANDLIPTKVRIDHIRTELLRIIWYSSTLNTLFTVLKTSLEGDSVVNILLGHNTDNERYMQSVIEAQEVALNCLSAMFHLVALSDLPAFVPLRDILKQTGSDLSDSSSLPFVVSVASFMFGNVREQTIIAAASCLTGVLQLCELARSVFTSRVGNLHERVLRVAMDSVHLGSSVEDLIRTMIETISCESSALPELVQKTQSLFRCVVPLISEGSIDKLSTSIEPNVITSGQAVALLRQVDVDATQFITSSIGSLDWLKTEILPSDQQVETLTSFYALLQARRIPVEWIRPQFDEPTLSHVLFAFAADSSDRRAEITSVNETIKSIESRLHLLDCIYQLLVAAKNTISVSLVPIYSALAAASIGSIRETPEIFSRLIATAVYVLENRVEQEGIDVFGTTIEKNDNALSIVVEFFRSSLLFVKNAPHRDLVVRLARIVPHLLLADESAELLAQLLKDLVRYVSVDFALAEPALLFLMDTLMQRSEDSDACEYVSNLFAVFSRRSSSSVITAKSTVALLSLIATCAPKLLHVDVCGILASHPVILAAAKAPSWDPELNQYSVDQLVWVYALYVMDTVGGAKFEKSSMAEKISTAHTSDLATLEEVCLYMRCCNVTAPAVFQFTSLISGKSPSIFPKSGTEKLAAKLGQMHDVQLPSSVPSIFAQRCVWLACDILASSLRLLFRTDALPTQSVASGWFHSLIDCSHFVFHYLKDLSGHKKQFVTTVVHNEVEYVPLSIFLHQTAKKNSTDQPTTPRKTPSSLLHSLPSPHMTPAVAKATLMDSLTPKNSPPKPATGASEEPLKFQAAAPGDCSVRTGLTFIVPSLVSLDDYTSKLVEVLSLCLIQAVRFGSTNESLLRPLIDLLMTMQAARDKLPTEANQLIAEILQQVVPKYNSLANLRTTHSALDMPT